MAGDYDFSETTAMKDYTVELSGEFHADLEWWKWAVCQRHILEGVSLYAFFYEHIEWPPVLSLIHISEPTRQEAISYAVFCLKKKKK